MRRIAITLFTLALAACGGGENGASRVAPPPRHYTGCPPVVPDSPPKHADIAAPANIDPALPNVLLIGDSISVGYTTYVRAELDGEANVYRVPDNAQHTCYGLVMLDDWLGGRDWHVIHFNWGLHDLFYRDGVITSTPEEYEARLEELTDRLWRAGATLIWAETTPIPAGQDPGGTGRGRVAGSEVTYNAIASSIMARYAITTNPTHNGPWNDHQLPADVHYAEAGSALLGGQVAAYIRAAL